MADDKTTKFVSSDERTDEVFQAEPRPGLRTIRFGSRDLEAARQNSQSSKLPRMSRAATNASQGSTASMASLTRVSRRQSIDPSTALPITYRTVSFAIDETKEKKAEDVAKVKDDAAAEFGCRAHG